MTLDEAIKHIEKVAEEQFNNAVRIRDEMKSAVALKNAEECEQCAEDLSQLAEWLKELKQLRVQTRLIPVSEKLPEYGEEVLTWSNSGFIEIQSLENCGDSYWENQKGDWSDLDEVIAWMPLPKSYSEVKK